MMLGISIVGEDDFKYKSLADEIKSYSQSFIGHFALTCHEIKEVQYYPEVDLYYVYDEKNWPKEFFGKYVREWAANRPLLDFVSRRGYEEHS